MMSGYEGETRRLVPPCIHCNGTTFVWGRLQGEYPLWFYPEDVALHHLMSRGGPEQTRARVCSTCGNVQLFLKEYPTS